MTRSILMRCHNLVWSVDEFVQDWVKALSGQALRDTVAHHIQETMNVTQGL
jgi:GH35 family endo-1,4-beta-xylanase